MCSIRLPASFVRPVLAVDCLPGDAAGFDALSLFEMVLPAVRAAVPVLLAESSRNCCGRKVEALLDIRLIPPRLGSYPVPPRCSTSWLVSAAGRKQAAWIWACQTGYSVWRRPGALSSPDPAWRRGPLHLIPRC